MTLIARPVDARRVRDLLWIEVAAWDAPPGTVPVWVSESAADLHGIGRETP